MAGLTDNFECTKATTQTALSYTHAAEPVGLRGDHPPAFVRVVVRTHEKQLLELRSLIYSLRGQAQRLRWLKLDFVLVPTEPGAQATYRALTQGALSESD